MRRALLIAALAAWSATAAADPVLLRMASVAPQGTAWANLLTGWGRELETITNGAVRVKWYFGAITGDELETYAGIQKGHLDGVASGGMICERLSPSIRIQGLTGVFQSRNEAAYVMERIKKTIQEDARRNGFEMLVTTPLGPEVIFSRTPVRTLADLRRLKLWRWSADEVGIAFGQEMKLQVVPLDLDQAAKAYDKGEIDGFIAIPTAALAFQWSAQARYITDLRSGYLNGCVAIAHRALDRVPAEHQQAVRSLMGKYDMLFQELSRRQDEALLGGLFVKQGLKPVPPSEALRSEFYEAARTARERLAEKLIPRAVLDRTLQTLADYRAEHRETSAR
jgi:TRAP-type C4-dicarboxylate transport system substrate-binding protein